MPFKKKVVVEETAQEMPVVQPAVAPKSVKNEWEDVVAATKRKLDNQEKINFIIPMQEGEKINFETVQINGYKLTIQKGVMVQIPKDVATILAEKYRILMDVGKENRIDRASDVNQALS